jgi:hypothetical protein
VLDAIDGPGGRQARLYRVDPYSGGALLVGQWPRGGAFDQHWLVLDREGRVLLAASSGGRREHALVRLAASRHDDGAPLGLSCATAPKALDAEPLIHRTGYSFAWRNPKGKLLLWRKNELHLTPCSLVDLGALL